MQERIQKLRQRFEKEFGIGRTRIFQAPGRVNLIGEHTDYNGGFVLPVAIDRSVLVMGAGRKDRLLNLVSLNFKKKINSSLENISYKKNNGWGNYPLGVARILQESGYCLQGVNLVFEGNVPIGSGLSSSAALEIASGWALCSLTGIKIDRTKLALLGQKAENEFVGMKCGIMDQFVIAQGKKNYALLLDCLSLNYELFPFKNENLRIVVANTKVKRELVSSAYNERRAQCEEGVRILEKYLGPLGYLRKVSFFQFNKFKSHLPGTVAKRCQHVISENERVLKAVRSLQANRFTGFGKLMNASHLSLKNLYEVSCRELDLMVESAWKIKGVLGARMTGAGFGGCTVNLVDKEAVEKFINKVGEEYRRKTKIIPEFYVCQIEDGVKEI